MRRKKQEGGRPLVYWDACIFIAHLKNEQRAIGEMDAVREQVRRLDEGETVVVASTLTLTEVLECDIPAENLPKLQGLKQIPDRLMFAQVSMPIAELAHDIRSDIKASGVWNGKTVKTPDAIHIATALTNGCEVLYTFDENCRGDGLGLIRLSGTNAVRKLPIEKPPPPKQTTMDREWDSRESVDDEESE